MVFCKSRAFAADEEQGSKGNADTTERKSMDKILLFIPMYNCEKQIVRVLGQLTDEVCSYLSEVIIVNNRSTDNGEQAVIRYLKEHPRKVRTCLLRNRENYGLGGSHKVAFQYGIKNGFDYVIVLHGDDQGSISDLLKYLKNGQYRKYDSFLGSRFMKGSKLVNYSRFRIFGNHVFNALISAAAGRRLSDLGSGLNMYRSGYLKSLFYMGFPDTLTFNVYMLLYGVYSKSEFDFFPLTWREEDQISNAKFVSQAKEILAVIIGYVLNREKTFAGKGKHREYLADCIYPNGEKASGSGEESLDKQGENE